MKIHVEIPRGKQQRGNSTLLFLCCSFAIPDFIKWSFAATGLTLPTDGSLDHKLDIQNSQRGVPEGMIIQ